LSVVVSNGEAAGIVNTDVPQERTRDETKRDATPERTLSVKL
jgi:hypothetical protein